MAGVKRHSTLVTAAVVALAMGAGLVTAMGGAPAQVSTPSPALPNKSITAADCTAARIGASIPVGRIGEPVSGVILAAPAWI